MEFQSRERQKGTHPAPFPVELPYRCIQIYTFEGDVVFDPFCGSGSSAIAAIKSNRDFLMIDNNKKYVAGAKRRIKELLQSRH